MTHITEYTFPDVYYNGRAARSADKPRVPPATLVWSDRHWWLAGWGDMDMEIMG